MTPAIATRVRNRLKRLKRAGGTTTFYYAEERQPDAREPRRVFGVIKPGRALPPKAMATRAAVNKHLKRLDPACPPLGVDAILCAGVLADTEDGFAVTVHAKRGCGKRQLGRGLLRLARAHRFATYDWLFDAADKPEPSAEDYAPWIAKEERALEDTIALALRGLDADAGFSERAEAERAEATLEKLLRRLSKLEDQILASDPTDPSPYAALRHEVAAALRALEAPAPRFADEAPGWSDRMLGGLEGAAELSEGFSGQLDEVLSYMVGAQKAQLGQISKMSVEVARMLRALASGAEMLLSGGLGALGDSVPLLKELSTAAKSLAGLVGKATDIDAIRDAAKTVTVLLGRVVGAVDLVAGSMAMYEAGARIHLARGASSTLLALSGDVGADAAQREAAETLLERLRSMERAGYFEGLLSAARFCEGLRLAFSNIPLIASAGGAISALWTVADKALRERATRLEEGTPRREELLAREGLVAFADHAAAAAAARGEASTLDAAALMDEGQRYLLAQMRASRAIRGGRFDTPRARVLEAERLLPGKGEALVEALDLATAIAGAAPVHQEAMLQAVGLTAEEWLTVTAYAEGVVRDSAGLDDDDNLSLGDIIQLRGLIIDSLVAALPEL